MGGNHFDDEQGGFVRNRRSKRSPHGDRENKNARGRNRRGQGQQPSYDGEHPFSEFPTSFELGHGETSMSDEQNSKSAPIMVGDQPLDPDKNYGPTEARGNGRRQSRGPSPFWAVVNFVLQIDDSRHDATIAELKARLDPFDERSQTNMLWEVAKKLVNSTNSALLDEGVLFERGLEKMPGTRLPELLDKQKTLLDEKRELPKWMEFLPEEAEERLNQVSSEINKITAPVFVIASQVRKMHVAKLAKALCWAMSYTNASIDEQSDAGVLISRGDKLTYMIRQDTIQEFAELLHDRGDELAAEILQDALRRNRQSMESGRRRKEASNEKKLADRLKAKAEAKAEAAKATSSSDGESTGPESSSDDSGSADAGEETGMPDAVLPTPLSEMSVEQLQEIVITEKVPTKARVVTGLVKAIEKHRAAVTA